MQTVQVVFESVRSAVKDTLAQDGWFRRIFFKNLLYASQACPVSTAVRGCLCRLCRNFHGHWQVMLHRPYLVIDWNRLLFSAFLRSVGKGSSQPLPSLEQCICASLSRIC